MTRAKDRLLIDRNRRGSPASTDRTRHCRGATAHAQAGALTLLVALLLMFVITLVVLYANRAIVFEQRTSANQYRSTIALGAAEAGMEWALAQLNTPLNLDATCAATTASGSRTFRDHYLNPAAGSPPVFGTSAGAFSAAQPACARQSSGAWTCACPAGNTSTVAAGTCNLASGECPMFRLRFSRVQDPAQAGTCASGATNCVNGAVAVTVQGFTDTTGTPDGTATVTQVLKVIAGLATPPAAPLTAHQNVSLSGNVNVTNTTSGTNGVTINAGGNVTFSGSAAVSTIPGTPAAASVFGNDTSLSSLTDDQFFQTFFGMTKTEFQNLPTTVQVTCSTCTNSELRAVVNAGATTIWVNGNLHLNGNDTFGSAARPLIIVVTDNIVVNGTVNIFGAMYSQAATWDNTGGGTAGVCGFLISEGNFTSTGSPDPVYPGSNTACPPSVLSTLTRTTGTFARVPGSWRDFGVTF